MSNETIFFIIAGLIYLTITILYFRKAIHELNEDYEVKPTNNAIKKQKHKTAKIYYLPSATR